MKFRKLFLKVGVVAIGWVDFSHLTCWRWALRGQELSEEQIIINFSFFLAPQSGQNTALESTQAAGNVSLGVLICPWISQTGILAASVSLVFTSLVSWASVWWEDEKVFAPEVSATLRSLLSAPYHPGAFTPLCPFVLIATSFQGGLHHPWRMSAVLKEFLPISSSRVQNPKCSLALPTGLRRRHLYKHQRLTCSNLVETGDYCRVFRAHRYNKRRKRRWRNR